MICFLPDDTIGPSYFPLAFKFAQQAVASTGKDIKLYYNDYGIENIGNKSDRVRELITDLHSQGIQFDGVGLESHFTVGQTPSYADQTANMKAFTDLGVEVAITELDIRFEDASTAKTNTSGLALQAQEYYDSVKACVDVEGCVGITVWDFQDAYSWIPLTFEGEGAADLYWEDYRRKPAYYAVGEALSGEECTVCS
jgi:endo-1,4-beta-xylanase